MRASTAWRTFPTWNRCSRRRPDLQCISICTPPQAHFDAALLALRAGKHVMLEKPPAATMRQIQLLAEEAGRRGLTLFQTWHSRFAAGVDAARQWLRTRPLTSGRIMWKEDVHFWHPGQRWIWEPGGFGVFDPGINALSVLTEILPSEVCVERATLEFPAEPAGADSRPICSCAPPRAPAIDAEFDFRQKGEQSWDIELQTGAGNLRLSRGGAGLAIDGQTMMLDEGMAGEYPRLYRALRATCARAADPRWTWRPFQLVADAFLVGERRSVAPHAI